MTTPEPTIRVAVDPTNPGQFFACCGLLELADRLWPGAEGWFADDGREFRIACKGGLCTALACLVMDPPEIIAVLPNGLTAPALLAPLRLVLDGGATTSLTLDAWTTIRLEKGEPGVRANPPWNFWSGQQTSPRIWSSLRETLAEQLPRLPLAGVSTLLQFREFLSGRFGFDPGPAWNALDVGFSPNEQGYEVEASAAVELLAAVGVQRFRPRMADDRASFVYATWGVPLSPCVAAGAAADMVAAPPRFRFRGRVISRGQYAALGYSIPLRGASDE